MKKDSSWRRRKKGRGMNEESRNDIRSCHDERNSIRDHNQWCNGWCVEGLLDQLIQVKGFIKHAKVCG